MNLNLLGFRYKNIREIKDLTVSLTNKDDSPYKNTLIQMPNGTGKTTTMKLIRYALDGSAVNADKEEILSFKPLFPTSETSGEFEVKVLIDDEVMYSTMVFDFESGNVKYFTTRTKLGGKTPGHNLGPEANSILTPSFVRLFVFDGEVAAAIKDIKKNEAEMAIKTLFYLDRISSINNTIDKIVKTRQQTAQNTGVKTRQGIKALQTQLENAKKTQGDLQQHLTELKQIISKNQECIKRINSRLDELGKKNDALRNKIEITKNKLTELEGKLNANADELLTISRDPINLHDCIAERLKRLGSIMTKMRLPRTTSKEFFDLLIEQDKCICGRELEEEHKEIIRNKIKDFLTEDEIGVINALKQTLRSIPEETNKVHVFIERALSLQREIQEQQTAYDRLIAKRNQGIDQELLDELEKKRDECKDDKKDAEDQLRLLTLEDTSELRAYGMTWEDNLHLCKLHIEELESKIQEASGTVKFSAKGKLLQEIINTIISNSLQGLKEEIKNRTNEKIVKILKQEDILIEDISSSVIIKSRGDVSEGQKLSIAYSFLASLFEQSYHNLPFIVDSPAVSIDLSVRREVSELIPPLFKQFVVFVISSERKDFGETFYDQDNTQFLTIYKDKERPGQMHINDTQEFFDAFQSEPEEEEGGRS